MSGPDSTPLVEHAIEALEQLTDIVIAAQELSHKFRENGRPFLGYCARQLEDECHSVFHQIELVGSGWEPTSPEVNDARR